MKQFSKAFLYSSLIVIFSILGACTMLENGNQRVVESSLVNYLYPDHSVAMVTNRAEREIPNIMLPTKIGIAFVPTAYHSGHSPLSESFQIELLQDVKAQFQQYDFIQEIEIIPTTYLKPQGGFVNLQQVARIHDVDLMALVSYDQVQKKYLRDSSIMYLTIVGAYIFKGETIAAETFIDTAVFDVRTETLLLRAPGLSSKRKNSTALQNERVKDSVTQQGFQLAIDDMNVNLEQELEQFKEKVKAGKKVKVRYAEGYSGGGQTSLFFLLLLVLIYKTRTIKPY